MDLNELLAPIRDQLEALQTNSNVREYAVQQQWQEEKEMLTSLLSALAETSKSAKRELDAARARVAAAKAAGPTPAPAGTTMGASILQARGLGSPRQQPVAGAQQAAAEGDDALKEEQRRLTDQIARLQVEIERAQREVSCPSHAGEHDIWEGQLVILQDTRRMLREEIALLEVELAARLRARQQQEQRAAQEAAGLAELQLLEEQLAALESKAEKTKLQLYFPLVRGFKWSTGSRGIYVGGKDLTLAELAGSITVQTECHSDVSAAPGQQQQQQGTAGVAAGGANKIALLTIQLGRSAASSGVVPSGASTPHPHRKPSVDPRPAGTRQEAGVEMPSLPLPADTKQQYPSRSSSAAAQQSAARPDPKGNVLAHLQQQQISKNVQQQQPTATKGGGDTAAASLVREAPPGACGSQSSTPGLDAAPHTQLTRAIPSTAGSSVDGRAAAASGAEHVPAGKDAVGSSPGGPGGNRKEKMKKLSKKYAAKFLTAIEKKSEKYAAAAARLNSTGATSSRMMSSDSSFLEPQLSEGGPARSSFANRVFSRASADRFASSGGGGGGGGGRSPSSQAQAAGSTSTPGSAPGTPASAPGTPATAPGTPVAAQAMEQQDGAAAGRASGSSPRGWSEATHVAASTEQQQQQQAQQQHGLAAEVPRTTVGAVGGGTALAMDGGVGEGPPARQQQQDVAGVVYEDEGDVPDTVFSVELDKVEGGQQQQGVVVAPADDHAEGQQVAREGGAAAGDTNAEVGAASSSSSSTVGATAASAAEAGHGPHHHPSAAAASPPLLPRNCLASAPAAAAGAGLGGGSGPRQGFCASLQCKGVHLLGEKGTGVPNMSIEELVVALDFSLSLQFEYSSASAGWRLRGKPNFSVHSLDRRVSGNKVPLPRQMLKTLLSQVVPRVLTRKLSSCLPLELGQYLLDATRTSSMAVEVALTGPRLDAFDVNLLSGGGGHGAGGAPGSTTDVHVLAGGTPTQVAAAGGVGGGPGAMLPKSRTLPRGMSRGVTSGPAAKEASTALEGGGRDQEALAEACKLLGLSVTQVHLVAELYQRLFLVGGRVQVDRVTLGHLLDQHSRYSKQGQLWEQLCAAWDSAISVACRARGEQAGAEGAMPRWATLMVALQRLGHKPLRARLCVQRLDVEVDLDGVLRALRDYAERTAREVHRRGPAALQDQPGARAILEVPLHQHLAALDGWYRHVTGNLQKFKARFKSAHATALVNADVRSLAAGLDDVHYEGPLRVKLPINTKVDDDGAVSFSLPLPSPGGKISTFVSTFRSTLAQGLQDAAAAAIGMGADEEDEKEGQAAAQGVDAAGTGGAAALKREVSTRLQHMAAAEEEMPVLQAGPGFPENQLGRVIVNRMNARLRIDEARVRELLAGLRPDSLGGMEGYASTVARLLGCTGDLLTVALAPRRPGNDDAQQQGQQGQYLFTFASAKWTNVRADLHSLGFQSYVPPLGLLRLAHALMRAASQAVTPSTAAEPDASSLLQRLDSAYLQLAEAAAQKDVEAAACVDAHVCCSEGAPHRPMVLRLRGISNAAGQAIVPLMLSHDLLLGRLMMGGGGAGGGSAGHLGHHHNGSRPGSRTRTPEAHMR